jgi:hypothetical protein
MRYPGFLIVLAACGSIDQTPEADAVFGPPVDDREQQGTTILGGLDTVGTIGAEYVPYYVGQKAVVGIEELDVTVVDGQLVIGTDIYNQSPSDFDGMTFTGFDGKHLKVTEAAASPTSEPIRARYHLELDGVDPCNGEYAIPVSGKYSIDARHQQQASAITFSCEKGEVYKCHDFGYGADGNPTSIKGKLHQACVYMAGARYCTDRRSFTREKTEISMFDRYGIREKFPTLKQPQESWSPWTLTTWPSPYDDFWIEAAWRADGTPICLAQSRWASLEPDPCNGALPDPRTVPGAKYCEEKVHEGTLTPNDVLIVNLMRVNDARFDMWRAASGDLLATSRGFVDEDPAGPTLTRPFGSNMTFVRKVGVLLRVPTDEMLGNVTLLSMYCKPMSNDCAVSATEPPGHTNDRGAEGYVFNTEQPGTARLWLWKNAADDYVSAIARPGLFYTKASQTALGWIYVAN